MRLDPENIHVESFTITDPGASVMFDASQVPCAATTSPCLDSQQTCGPECMAVGPEYN